MNKPTLEVDNEGNLKKGDLKRMSSNNKLLNNTLNKIRDRYPENVRWIWRWIRSNLLWTSWSEKIKKKLWKKKPRVRKEDLEENKIKFDLYSEDDTNSFEDDNYTV